MAPMPEFDDTDDGYDAAINGFKSYNLAIRTIRLSLIRDGKESPRLDDPEEVATARCCMTDRAREVFRVIGERTGLTLEWLEGAERIQQAKQGKKVTA